MNISQDHTVFGGPTGHICRCKPENGLGTIWMTYFQPLESLSHIELPIHPVSALPRSCNGVTVFMQCLGQNGDLLQSKMAVVVLGLNRHATKIQQKTTTILCMFLTAPSQQHFGVQKTSDPRRHYTTRSKGFGRHSYVRMSNSTTKTTAKSLMEKSNQWNMNILCRFR